MSLCDSCYSPGICCKNISFSTAKGEVTFWADESIEKQISEDARFESLEEHPFQVDRVKETWTSVEDKRDYSTFYFKCSALTSEGRCSIYDKRPNLCRIYEPALDRNCVHYRGSESGDPTAVNIERIGA